MAGRKETEDKAILKNDVTPLDEGQKAKTRKPRKKTASKKQEAKAGDIVKEEEKRDEDNGVNSEIEQYVNGSDSKRILYILEPRYRFEPKTDKGVDLEVEVVQSLPMSFYTDLMKQVPRVYFGDAGYDPFFGRSIIEMILFEAYTGMKFGDDVDVYNKFKSLYCYCPSGVLQDVVSVLPLEASRFLDAAEKKIDQLCRMYFTPVETSNLMESCKGFVDTAKNSLQKIDAYLDKYSQEEGAEKVSIKDLVEALKNIGNLREKEIAATVLNFQAAKARKKATRENTAVKE